MDHYSNHIRTIAVIVLLALPALTIRVVSNHNPDLYLLPLSPANEGRVATYEGSDKKGFARIDVRVNWPDGWSGAMTQAELRERISNVLKHRTEFYKIEFVDHAGARIEVTFTVGPNVYGPFSPAGMADGLRTALIALRTTNGPETF